MTAGQKVWNNVTDKLSVELFDSESEGLRDFLELIRAQSEVMGWNLSVLSIPVDVNDNLGDTQDFLSHYGEIDLGHYNQQNRAAQDSMMLYTCVMNSMSLILVATRLPDSTTSTPSTVLRSAFSYSRSSFVKATLTRMSQ
jgi:hypothetical protein